MKVLRGRERTRGSSLLVTTPFNWMWMNGQFYLSLSSPFMTKETWAGAAAIESASNLQKRKQWLDSLRKRRRNNEEGPSRRPAKIEARRKEQPTNQEARGDANDETVCLTTTSLSQNSSLSQRSFSLQQRLQQKAWWYIHDMERVDSTSIAHSPLQPYSPDSTSFSLHQLTTHYTQYTVHSTHIVHILSVHFTTLLLLLLL